jgi:hypothetical protein
MNSPFRHGTILTTGTDRIRHTISPRKTPGAPFVQVVKPIERQPQIAPGGDGGGSDIAGVEVTAEPRLEARQIGRQGCQQGGAATRRHERR